MKMTEKVVDFVRLSPEKKHHFFQDIWRFDQEIFPVASIDYLYDYLHDIDAVSIPVVQYFADGNLVGQNLIRILKLDLDDRPIFVFNSRAGFLPQYRRQNQSLHSAIRIALQYKLKHPHIPFWFAPTIMQPKVYMLFASRTSNFYPRANKQIPEQHHRVLKRMLSRKKNVEERGEGIYVYPCDLPKADPEHLMRLRNNAEVHVNFFMQHLPDYFDGLGMMCICELDLKTILETTINLTLDRRIS